jgi:hypothetical protein
MEALPEAAGSDWGIAEWSLAVSLFLVLAPWIVTVFAAIWRWGPEVGRDGRETERRRMDEERLAEHGMRS